MTWLRRLLSVTATIAFVLLCAAPSEAAGDPDLDWWTIETKHFRIHYEKDLEPVATRVARLSEAIHSRLIGPLGYVPSERTEVAITDFTDRANGSATAVPFNAVRLFVTAPGDVSALGDYDNWYLGLMTHEYTHILHIDNVSGIPSLVNAVIGKTLIPNQLQPRWILEGLAVVAESAFSSGGRIRSSLFDMFIRADVVDGNIARLDQMSAHARRWPRATLWYLYGSRFVQWIVDVYGLDTIRAVSVDYGASVLPFGVNRAIRRQTGKTYEELYEGFVDHLERGYARQLKTVRTRGLREGKRVTFHGMQVHYPRFVPKSARQGSKVELVYLRDDSHNRSGIYRLDLAVHSGSQRPREQLLARTSGGGPAAFGPDGTLFFSSVVPFKRAYRRTDLFSLPPGQRAPAGDESFRRRLTVGLRADAPTVGPLGRQVAFTVNQRGTTTLKLAELSAEGKLSGTRTLVPSKPFDQAYTPVISPDGGKLAYSAWLAGGYRDIRIVDLATGAVDQVTNDRALDTNPAWSADGSKLYFSSDRTGIFNIYQLDLETRQLKQVTNVQIGALMPTVSEDGKLLVYVGYTTAGYDLYAMGLDPARYLEALPPPKDRPDPYGEAPPVPMTKRRYNPLPTLMPHRYGVELSEGNFDGYAALVTVEGADMAGHHGLAFSLLADPAAPLPQLAFDYVYRRLPVDLSLRVSNRVTRRTDFRFNDQKPEYYEKAYGVRSGISYTDAAEFSTQRISFAHNATILDAELPMDQVGALDPYATTTKDPLRGFLSLSHVGYSFSNVEGSFFTAGSARGFSLALGLDVADEFLGSQESLYSADYRAVAYFPMPWPGRHTLAIRSAGGLAKGTYSRRGVFGIGGYNLTNLSLLDTLTTTIFDAAFVLRGYEPGAFFGSTYVLENLEYRFPIADVDRGPSTLPIFLRRIDGNLFLDYGGAFNKLDYDDIELMSDGALIHSDDLHTGAGVELWFGVTLAHVVNMQMRLGYAYGFSGVAIDGGQWYFLASNAF